jgi:uncharacterized protein (DUF58 family)
LRRRLVPVPRSRSAAAVALGAAAVLASLGFGTPALMPLGVGLILLPALAVAAVRVVGGRLRMERALSPARLPAGASATVTVRMAGGAAGALALLGWRLDPGIPQTVGTVRQGPGSGGRERSWEIPLVRRGEHRLAPAELTVGDPFGLVDRRYQGDGEALLLGLAPVVPIAVPFWERAAGLRRASAWSAAGAHELDRVRDYQPGDPLGRVHWAQTAKRGRLQTKELRGSAGRGESRLLLLDGSASSAGEPFEVAVAAAASLLRHAGGHGDGMAFEHSGGGAPPRLPAGAPWSVFERALATVTAEGPQPASMALAGALRRSGGLRSVVLASAAPDPALAGGVRAARQRGVAVCCVLAGPAGAAAAPDLRRAGATVAVAMTLADLPAALESSGGRAAGPLTASALA